MRSSAHRVLAALGIVTSVLLGLPQTAAAHGSVDATDYRVELTSVTGDLTGAEVRIVALGERLEVERTTAAEVIVLGYQGEPYLRLDDEGVWRNTSSPATYLNEDRYAAVTLPAQADAAAEPTWEHVSSGSTMAWHDHRSHWMSPEPPPIVTGDSDREHVVYEDAVALRVDGRDVSIATRVTWIPPPASTIWLTAASVAGALALLAVARWRASAWVVTMVGAAAAVIARPGGYLWGAATAGGLLLAVVAWRRRSSLLGAGAGAITVAAAAVRFEVFSRALVPGSLPAPLQRVLLLVAIAGGVAGVFAAVMAVATPDTSERTSRTAA